MDGLARSLIELHRLVDDLAARDISVKFLKEGQTKRYIPYFLPSSFSGCLVAWRNLSALLFVSARRQGLHGRSPLGL
jgi:hypothetical protein